LIFETERNQSVKSEIIIVDDGSTDNTADIIKHYPVQYIYQNNSGPGVARNTGWQSAAGDIICFTDSDCVPETDWVKMLLEKYTSEDIGAAGGSYEIQNKESFLAECIHEEIIQRHDKIPTETNFLGSFNVSYRKSVLEKVGGFNGSFRTASGEDNDLAYRVKKAGYKLIFDKNIKVAHYHQSKLSKYLKEQYRHGYWRMMLYKKHPDMATGDSYAGIFDFLQPPLALAIVGVLLISFFNPSMLYVSFFLIVVLFMLQFPVALRAVARNNRFLYLYILFAFFLRAFARALGMIKGIMRFFVLGKLINEHRETDIDYHSRF
jgi:glycosyltransferase involved in cell wall biosynthesis